MKHLREAVFAIQRQLGAVHRECGTVRHLTSLGGQQNDSELNGNPDEYEDDSDDASSRSSEIILQDRPSHMDPLFQNELITTDARRTAQMQHIQQGHTMTQRLESARRALQPLIPTQEQLTLLSSHVSSWLTLLQELSPITSLSASKEGIISSYPSMKEPDVDPLKLACWLLALAITAQQLNPEIISPETPGKKLRTAFPQAVQRVVENYIISHDSLCGTLAGLETYFMFLRLTLMKGIIQKSWLGLRRLVAIAELIGLPRASKVLQQRPISGTSSVDPHTSAKAKLWENICSIERLASTLMHFPVATRHYSLITYEPLVANGVVNIATFWTRLGNIAVQLSDLDELASSPSSEPELYTQVLRLDNESRLLASQTPQEWWLESVTDKITPGDIVKFQFHCVNVRIHLPLVVRSDTQNRFAFSRMAGVDSCRRLISAWCDLRRILPSGIFFARPFDSQAFIASVVLLLNSYNSRASSISTSDSLGSFTDSTDTLLSRVVQLMDEKALDPVGSEYAQQASSALRSLISLLKGDSESNELTARIPSLGTITVRRKHDRWATLDNATTDRTSQLQHQNFGLQATSSLPPHQFSGDNFAETQASQNPSSPHLISNSVDDAFSWVINPNDELFFHDNLIFEDEFGLQPWQEAY